jgi:uncharacterized protein (DUF697 family)
MSSYVDTLKKLVQGDYMEATAEERAKASAEVVQMSSIASAAVAVQPFPLVDALLITPVQILMVQAIGKIHGYTVDKKSVLEILSTLGASLVTQNLIIAAAKLVPFAGWMIGVSMAYALTWAVGEVSVHYFRGGRGMAKEDLETMFQKVYREKRAEKDGAHQNDPSLKARLEQLNEAREAGLLTEDEFTAKKEEVLKSF